MSFITIPFLLSDNTTEERNQNRCLFSHGGAYYIWKRQENVPDKMLSEQQKTRNLIVVIIYGMLIFLKIKTVLPDVSWFCSENENWK